MDAVTHTCIKGNSTVMPEVDRRVHQEMAEHHGNRDAAVGRRRTRWHPERIFRTAARISKTMVALSAGQEAEVDFKKSSRTWILHSGRTAETYVMTDQLSRADIMACRKAERHRLIDERLAVDASERRRCSIEIGAKLHQLVGELANRTVSGYWPFKGEPDLRPWMQTITEGGGRCALPVVVVKSAPLVFRVWQQGGRLERGVWNIPVPADGAEVVPDIVIAPLIGFDKACYRLGYGGGYYDRTLAAFSLRPLIIGVGYARAAMISIHPLPHDIPMDIIVTEDTIIRRSAPDHRAHSLERRD